MLKDMSFLGSANGKWSDLKDHLNSICSKERLDPEQFGLRIGLGPGAISPCLSFDDFFSNYSFSSGNCLNFLFIQRLDSSTPVSVFIKFI